MYIRIIDKDLDNIGMYNPNTWEYIKKECSNYDINKNQLTQVLMIDLKSSTWSCDIPNTAIHYFTPEFIRTNAYFFSKFLKFVKNDSRLELLETTKDKGVVYYEDTQQIIIDLF